MVIEYLKSLGRSHDEVVNRVRVSQGLNNNGQHGYHFIVACLKILYPNITEQELVDSIVDGPHDQQIDTIVIKNNIVDIFDFKGNLGYGENDIRLFKDSVRSLFFARNAFDNRNQRLVNQVNKAISAIDVGARIRIRIARTSPAQVPRDIQELVEELAYGSIIEHKIYSGNNLVNEYLKIDSSPINYKWRINTKVENRRNDEAQNIVLRRPIGDDTIESLFCRLSLKSLVDLYYSQSPSEIIFESNVRSLQNDRKIKSEMLDSLSSGNLSKKFHKLHNGITIVCSSITNESNTRFEIENPQIVNGCQTVTNLSKEFANDRNSNKLKNGSVLCKIFHATNDEVERICLASNSQVSINPWDLRTNDPIQRKIESYLNINGINYSRKAKNRGNNDLTFVELGQWLYSAIHRQPMLAKNKRRSIFDASRNNIYQTVFNDNLDPREVLKIVRDGIFIRKHIKNLRNVFEKQADLHFLAGFYMLKDKNWQSRTKFNRIKAKVNLTVAHMRNTYDNEMKYDTMFAKKVESWNDLEQRIEDLI